jgi:hypothetical protein
MGNFSDRHRGNSKIAGTAACRLSAAGSCHPGTATQPGMSMSRGISKGFRIVAPFRSFPSPVTATAGAAVLGLFRELRTQPIKNRPRTSRRGQVEHKPVAMSPASARPPRLAHSPCATSCRNNTHRPHRSLHSAAPLKPLPQPVVLGSTASEDRLASVARSTNIAWSRDVDEIVGTHRSAAVLREHSRISKWAVDLRTGPYLLLDLRRAEA